MNCSWRIRMTDVRCTPTAWANRRVDLWGLRWTAGSTFAAATVVRTDLGRPGAYFMEFTSSTSYKLLQCTGLRKSTIPPPQELHLLYPKWKRAPLNIYSSSRDPGTRGRTMGILGADSLDGTMKPACIGRKDIFIFLFCMGSLTMYCLVSKPMASEVCRGMAQAKEGRPSGPRKTILLYDRLLGSWKNWLRYHNFHKHLHCRVGNATYRCDVSFGTHDGVNLKEADFVMFSWYWWDRFARSSIPEKTDGSIWGIFTNEAPVVRHNAILPIDWVFTYESDADVITRYGRFSRREKPDLIHFRQFQRTCRPQKRKLAVALISDCHAPSKREELIRDLQRENLTVDVYGYCGKGMIVGNNIIGYQYLWKKYKFFLAFENAICKDYVTEKFFDALRFPWVPVVLGGANYFSLAPPNSYIDVRDFSSVRSLAHHLRHLDGNNKAYRLYFQWKSKYIINTEKGTMDIGCRICERLYTASRTEPPPDLKSFSKHRRCFFPNSTNDIFSKNFNF
ncbi:unnamed protein product [Darwinula stevensoni]|uniref:Fucosyltransferase n=1 Tax=Darwinula stevensoni TaxID=69355 RepID=A0A7R9A4B3_9CRUS|nr:unnamed protein product [Darwinula stevensoni]CAG0892208.1 unnamed protein product [Darwinula stevensoni]